MAPSARGARERLAELGDDARDGLRLVVNDRLRDAKGGERDARGLHVAGRDGHGHPHAQLDDEGARQYRLASAPPELAARVLWVADAVLSHGAEPGAPRPRR